MSRMSDLDAELQRLSNLDMAVRNYLSHLAEFEQGVGDAAGLERCREQLDELTSSEWFDYAEEVA